MQQKQVQLPSIEHKVKFQVTLNFVHDGFYVHLSADPYGGYGHSSSYMYLLVDFMKEVDNKYLMDEVIRRGLLNMMKDHKVRSDNTG